MDKSLLTRKIAPIDNDRQMKMEIDQDRMEVSIENLHLISQQRRQFHEARRGQGSQHDGMLRALTTSKSRT